jgi:hypothetical protein
MANLSGDGAQGPKVLLAKPTRAPGEGSGGSGLRTGIQLMRDRDDDGAGRRIILGRLTCCPTLGM